MAAVGIESVEAVAAVMPRTAARLPASRTVTRALRAAPATVGVVAAIIAVWFLERALSSPLQGGRAVGYMALGALPNAMISGRGDPSQMWRWMSSGLVHIRGNPTHLISNSVALLVVGWSVERLYGRLVVLGSLAVGVAAGSFTWLAATALDLAPEPDYTIGISAGICALVGVMLAYGYRERHHLSRRRARSMQLKAGLGIELMVLMGAVVPNLNNYAHAGGLVAGCLVGLCLPTSYDGGRPILGRQLRGALTIVLMLGGVSLLFAGQNLVALLRA